MKKIERILAIIVLLLDNEVVSTAQLARRFNVSKRTIFRDIETIEMAGFPITSHSGRKGGFSLLSSFKLRTYTYSEEEKETILSALDIKEGLFGIVDGQEIIKEKIMQLQKAINHKNESNTPFSFESPTMHRAEIEVETKKKINQINVALKQNKKVVIDYVDNRGKYTKRLIHPYELMLMNGSWYIYSYCENRDAFRYFKITRIRRLAIQSIQFVSQEYTNEFVKTHEEDKIQLRFKKEELGKLYDYYTEDEIKVKETYVEVTVYMNQHTTILPLLLMFGSSVNVIAPEKLKELHKQEIAKLSETYPK
ncbi:helix-turn-helix transcriptional regulator [Candidatus Enterococcus mansonii]|uniref:HTH deoR-type domain-containing protein n=1 Tax=Candidatus Enterococcus mansonii TaxID=1834181 RepID=A0A242CF63_9ENTE|nr:YafY family protein [Enterococcus sp. 4G2_DIV0659]OTO08758.1 hypothetical protein A5880_001758 [Enterococcus sp. 4G2_DIV0659]